MANYLDALAITAVTEAGVVDTVILTTNAKAVEILNVDGADNLSFTVNDPPVPTVFGAGMYVVPAAINASLVVPCPAVGGRVTVAIISASPVTYTVTAVS